MHPNHPLGYKPEAVYDAGQIDSVDTMSGSLNVTIPIGPFNLTYNSNVWIYETVVENGEVYIHAMPNKKSNAGLGWQLGIGEVYSPSHSYNPTGLWMYVDQFGGRHVFYDKFDRDHDDGDGNATQYTRDGSYLRLKKINGCLVRIESPDGTTRQFEAPTCGGGSDHLLTKVWDPFGSPSNPDMTITRNGNVWTVSDRYGRNHYLTFDTSGPWLTNPGVVTSADIESFDGQRAVYTLTYWDKALDRSCKDDYPSSSARVTVPHLQEINLPDGTSYKMIENGSLTYENFCNGISDRPGFLNKILLPTGGAYAWTVQEYQFPGSSPWNTSAGVETRKMLDSSGGVFGTWNYKQTKLAPSGGDEAEMVTWVQQPDSSGSGGACTKHYFFGDDTKSWEYGLPYTKRQAQVGGKYLSSEIWSDSNLTNGQCMGTKLRSTYLNYRHNVLPTSGTTDQSKWTATSRRVEDSRVIYHDDGGRYIDSDSIDDDGLGHWRMVTTSHNFHDNANVVRSRTDTVRYNANGTLSYWDGNWQPPQPSDPWILGVFEWTHGTDDDATGQTNTRKRFQFDSNTGFLECTRQSKLGGWMGANDIIQVFVPTARGEVAEVKTYGGDHQTLGTGSVCDAADLPSDFAAKVKHTYQFGVRNTSRPFKPNGTPDGSPNNWRTYDVDLDPSTGLVIASRDPNGLTTTFDYDLMGRPTTVTLPNGAYAETEYNAPTASSPAKIIFRRKWSSGFSLEQTAAWFDDFGRPWKQRHLDAGGVWSEAETLYNARGWVTSRSNLGDTSQLTQYLNYDAFGRPATIRPPGGSAQDIDFTYTGDRKVKQQADTYLIVDGLTPTDKTTDRDGFGRIVQVEEPSGENGATVTSSYEYDVNGNLTKVVQGPHETGIYQTRTFTYNNLGNLLSETHPEIGSTGNGTVTYSGYDARRNPARRNDGRVHVKYNYDWLGRLTTVQDANNGYRKVTETIYDTATGPGLGKPHDQIRYNYLDLPWNAGGEEEVKVRTRYTYRAADGLVTNLQTTVWADLDSSRSNEWQQFSVNPNPNAWGLTNLLTYPNCTHSTCSGTVPAARQLDTDWSQGRIIRVNGWTGDLTYHPSGTWATIPHLNGTQDHHDLKSGNNARTESLYTLNGGVLWNTETYRYDAWGNIYQIGNSPDHDWYRYDQANRLVRASVEDPTGQRTQQDYDYDAFGNITEVKTWPPGGGSQTTTIAVNANTNRLSSAGYDGSGNMTSWGGNSYAYDTGNSMVKQNNRWTFLYTFAGERIATIDWQGSIATREVDWTIRGPSNQVLSTFKLVGEDQAGNWSREIDYIWMGRRLLGTEDGSGTKRHYHTDHLGSIRLVTGAAGNKVSEHEYLPYGQELTAAGDGVMKFTGHERDLETGMDYMHARFYSSFLGRFNSVDPILGGGGVLNRYSYVGGRPMNFIDPLGRDGECTNCFEDKIDVYGDWWNVGGGGGNGGGWGGYYGAGGCGSPASLIYDRCGRGGGGGSVGGGGDDDGDEGDGDDGDGTEGDGTGNESDGTKPKEDPSGTGSCEGARQITMFVAVGGNLTPLLGADVAGGLFNDGTERGLFGSEAAGAGLSAGADVTIGGVLGGAENLRGQSYMVNFSFGVSLGLIFNEQGDFIGAQLGAGPGAGVNITAPQTYTPVVQSDCP